MILQALVKYYEDLEKSGKMASEGWSQQKVSYALEIGDDGTILHVSSLGDVSEKRKKTFGKPIEVPFPVKKKSGVAASFLCDNSQFILGFDKNGVSQRSVKCFEACRKLHQELLSDCVSKAAKAVLAFFEKWEPEEASSCEAISGVYEELMAGGNIIFYYDMEPVHEIEEIREAWAKHYWSVGEGEKMTCLVTGKYGAVEKTHPDIKGIRGAQPAGAPIVSFNKPAFCSYGKEQNLNAPVSKYAAFAYTSALNYIISEGKSIMYMGDDTAVLFWADGADDNYAQYIMGAMGNGKTTYSEADLLQKTQSILRGEKVEFNESYLDPNCNFYILGISPNAGRLSVRFFMNNTFGDFIKNLNAHYERMDIVRASFDTYETVPMWRMLQETVNMNSRNKSPSPNMTGAVLQAILTDTRYPATLLNGVTLRIRADRRINRERAAIIKAYYLKNRHEKVPEGVLTVSLNRETDYVPYCLGRLFAVYEKIQHDVSPALNSTIKDKYFGSASSTPAVVFPQLDKLSQNHLKKLRRDGSGKSYYIESIRNEIMDKLPMTYPVRLSLPEQGSFQLGYYHQVNALYTKKQEDSENV